MQKLPQQSLFSPEEIKKISENIAHHFSENLQTFAPYYDIDEIIRTMSAIEKGQIELIPSADTRIAFLDFQYKILEDQAQKNLEMSQQFLSQLAGKGHVIEVQKGKLYYEVLQEGSGEQLTEDSTPLLHFIEQNLTGTIFQDTHASGPAKIPLRETILGFHNGVIGMRVGEKRKIYTHPDLAYKNSGERAQQLIIFEVEILSNGDSSF